MLIISYIVVGVNMKKLLCALCALVMLLPQAGCGEEAKEPHIDIGDPESGAGITSASDLIDFFKNGGEKAMLSRSIDLGSSMITLSKDRGSITIEGKGNTISGNGDCVIRLDDGAKLTLNNVNITGGTEGIGGLGSGSISGECTINAVSHAVDFAGGISIGEGSKLYIKSNRGSAIRASNLLIGKNSAVFTQGGASAVNVFGDDIELDEKATLEAVTDDNYNALKCTGALIMQDASTFKVTNNGEYHGAELNKIELNGVVTIEAKGGDKGVGIFVFNTDNEYYALGFCKPDIVFETGDGSITFVNDPSEIPEPTPEPTEEQQQEE